MKARKITTKRAKEFTDKFTERILELGAVKIKSLTDSHVTFELSTRFGRLEIYLYSDHVHCFTVFSCFDDVDKAKAETGCNPYSGKFNHHRGLYDDETVNDAVDMAIGHFKWTLEKVKI